MAQWWKFDDSLAGFYVAGHPWRHPMSLPLTPTGGHTLEEISQLYGDAIEKISGKVFTYHAYYSAAQLMGASLTRAYLLNGQDVTSPGVPLDGEYWFDGSAYACAGGMRDGFSLFRTAYCGSYRKFTLTEKRTWQLWDGQERWVYRYQLKMEMGPSDDDTLITCQAYTATWKSTLDSWNGEMFYTGNRYALTQHDLNRNDYALLTPTEIVDRDLVRRDGPPLYDFRTNRQWDFGPDWLTTDNYTFAWHMADEVHPADRLSRAADALSFGVGEAGSWWENALKHEHQWYVVDGRPVRVKANGDICAVVDIGVPWFDDPTPLSGPQGDHATFDPPSAVADATTQIEYRRVETW